MIEILQVYWLQNVSKNSDIGSDLLVSMYLRIVILFSGIDRLVSFFRRRRNGYEAI